MAKHRELASGNLASALAHASALLRQDPRLAGEQAREILSAYPGHAAARQILAAAMRQQGAMAEALDISSALIAEHPSSAPTLHEHALCLAAAGNGREALENLHAALAVDAGYAIAWRSLGDHLAAAGDERGSNEAYERYVALSTAHPELIEAADFFRQGKIAEAERRARSVLKKDPVDVSAIRLLAEIGLKLGQFDDAINLLQRCLQLAPEFQLARRNYVAALSRRQHFDEALVEIEKMLASEPGNPSYLLLKGSTLVQKGEHQQALLLYESFLKNYPMQAGAHMNYGHTLKTIGRVDESVAAYRRAIELRPATGEAYWSLANLKTFRFSDAEIAAMSAEIDTEKGDPDDQSHLQFALGKAYEDRQQYDQAFGYYATGNQIRSQHHRYDAKINVFNTVRQIKTLDKAFFAARKGWGHDAPDPIFIVGLPRAGSTLLEQILASHSQVDGTAELPDIIAISRRLGKKSRQNPASHYPEILGSLTSADVDQLGKGYIDSTRVQRRGSPYFIDKMPNNFQHIGLIHLVLPNAKIIDARRHPMAAGFACFKQLFARGQAFTYDLTHLAYYYRDYVKLMDHWDAVLPGRVLHMQYEDVVRDTENQVRRLLAYCGLEFEEQCLRFYETERAVRTPSSEQVRQPVYTEGLEQWREFDAHLAPLRNALGPLLDRYPAD
jgi:tetratricopeptide (TPR) repeat protein